MRAAIMASGPSMNAEDAAAVRAWRDEDRQSRLSIAVNDTFRLAPWADILYACDIRWWNQHVTDVRAVFTGEMWTQDRDAASRHGLKYIAAELNAAGLSRTKGLIHGGGNSGYQAIGLASELGAGYIALIGFDMQNTNGRSHWHGDHPGELKKHMPFETWRGRFAALAADAKKAGVEIVNASRSTSMLCFPRVELSQALKG